MNWKNELYNVIKFSGGNDKVGIADCIGSGWSRNWVALIWKTTELYKVCIIVDIHVDKCDHMRREETSSDLADIINASEECGG